MKLDASQFGWIQKMAGGALGGVAAGLSSSSMPEAVASGVLASIPAPSVYEYNLTEFPGKDELEMIVYRTSVELLKSNVKLEIGRAKIPRILFMQSSAKQEFCQKYMDEVVKQYEAKPDKVADLLPTPEISEDVMAMLELQQMKAAELSGAISVAKSKWTPDEKIAEIESQIKYQETLGLAGSLEVKYMKAELNAMKQSYKETQIKDVQQGAFTAKGIAGMQASKLPIYYNPAFIKNLKAQVPYVGSKLQGLVSINKPSSKVKPVVVPDADDGFSGAGDEQKFLQRIGVMSNLHVDLQGKTIAYKTKEYRLKCSKCGQFTALARIVAEKFLYEDPVLVEFCKLHRHVAEVKEPIVGRKFRADN